MWIFCEDLERNMEEGNIGDVVCFVRWVGDGEVWVVVF